MKATQRTYEGQWLVISEINYIPVDNSEYGQSRKADHRTTMIDIYALVRIAKENGFDIPEAAFIHNYAAWRGDYKSNFHYNGINVFTPCRCNELSFSIFFGEGHTYYA